MDRIEKLCYTIVTADETFPAAVLHKIQYPLFGRTEGTSDFMCAIVQFERGLLFLMKMGSNQHVFNVIF